MVPGGSWRTPQSKGSRPRPVDAFVYFIECAGGGGCPAPEKGPHSLWCTRKHNADTNTYPPLPPAIVRLISVELLLLLGTKVMSRVYLTLPLLVASRRLNFHYNNRSILIQTPSFLILQVKSYHSQKASCVNHQLSHMARHRKTL